MTSTDETAETSQSSGPGCGQPVCLLVLGMAGTGKTTFVNSLSSHLRKENSPPYIINLDPACRDVPYQANIDIRTSINYKQIINRKLLGPNAAINTSLILFATNFDKVVESLANDPAEVAIFDTPGQIEVFTWSTSGAIMTEVLANRFATVVVYVMDTPRSLNPVTFMSNMLNACLIMCKFKLPFIVVMNKIDLNSHQFALDWVQDFELFEQAFVDSKNHNLELARSMSAVLDVFYKDLVAVGVSAVTGEGMGEFMEALGRVLFSTKMVIEK